MRCSLLWQFGIVLQHMVYKCVMLIWSHLELPINRIVKIRITCPIAFWRVLTMNGRNIVRLQCIPWGGPSNLISYMYVIVMSIISLVYGGVLNMPYYLECVIAQCLMRAPSYVRVEVLLSTMEFNTKLSLNRENFGSSWLGSRPSCPTIILVIELRHISDARGGL